MNFMDLAKKWMEDRVLESFDEGPERWAILDFAYYLDNMPHPQESLVLL